MILDELNIIWSVPEWIEDEDLEDFSERVEDLKNKLVNLLRGEKLPPGVALEIR